MALYSSAQNAVAHASGAFAMEVDTANNFVVTGKPTIIISGGKARAVSIVYKNKNG